MYLVKGLTRRVIVIKSPDPRLFEEAIFIVREDALRESGVTSEEIIKEAQDVAGRYVHCHLKKSIFRNIPAPFYTLVGAALTALVWWATMM